MSHEQNAVPGFVLPYKEGHSEVLISYFPRTLFLIYIGVHGNSFDGAI